MAEALHTSVADQGVELEHIVQDSVSDDGTMDWLPQDARVKAYIEKDRGMYDAVNRGMRKAKGEIIAYMNCDEQYLPGALKAVWEFFVKHPRVEVVFADTVVVNEDGSSTVFAKCISRGKATRGWIRFARLPAALFSVGR